jgi:hypothetical protein
LSFFSLRSYVISFLKFVAWISLFMFNLFQWFVVFHVWLYMFNLFRLCSISFCHYLLFFVFVFVFVESRFLFMNCFVVFSWDTLRFKNFACCMCTLHIPTFDISTIMFLIMQLLYFVIYVNYSATSIFKLHFHHYISIAQYIGSIFIF